MTASRIVPPAPLASRPFTSRQDEILDGIERIVLEEGFRDLRITDVAERLRCSNGTLYQLAQSKDELLMLVIDRWYQRSGRRIWRRLDELDDPVERFEVLLDMGVDAVQAVSPRFREDVASHAPIRQLVAAHTQYYLAMMESLIEEGVAAGSFGTPHPHLVAEAAEAALARLQDPRVLRATGATEAEASEALKQLLLHGVLTPAAARRRSAS